MTEGTGVILYVLLLSAIAWLAVQASRRAEAFSAVARRERLRHEWEIAQDRFETLVESHRLSEKSETYRRLRKIHDALADNPFDYHAIAFVLRKQLLGDAVRRRLEKERSSWPSEMVTVLQPLAQGTDLLLSTFSHELLHRRPLEWLVFRLYRSALFRKLIWPSHASLTSEHRVPRILREDGSNAGVDLVRGAVRLKDLVAD